MIARHALVQALKLVESPLGDSLGGQFGGVALDARDRLEKLPDLLDGKAADPRAAPGNEIHEPFGREQLDRLADRGARDPKDGGEIGLVQAFADLKAPLHDHVAQTLGGGFVQRLGADDRGGTGPAAASVAKKVCVRHVAHGDFASVARHRRRA